MEIDEIKKRLSMKTVLAHYNLVLNRNNHINCPFHDDKTPSMKFFEESDTLYCYSGNCETKGHSLDVIDLVMKMENCTKHEAILKCVERIGVIDNERVVNQKWILTELWGDLQKTYQNERSKGFDYAAKRCLLDLDLGYNNGRWHRTENIAKEKIEAAKAVGFLLPSKASNGGMGVWAKDCLIFALRDAAGEVVSFYGRSVVETGSNAKHFYMKNRCGLYPKYPAANCKKIILTESVIDAATLLQITAITDEYGVLALYGTNGLTQEHRLALGGLKELQEVVLMLDGDEAGQKASASLGEFLAVELPGVVVKIVDTPKDMDVNELWVNHLNKKLFFELLAEARVVKNSIEKNNPSTGSGLEIKNADCYIYETDLLKIEILGGINMQQIDRLKATLVISRNPKRSALDIVRQTVDLYHHTQVNGLLKRLHETFEIPTADLRLLIAELTEELETFRVEQQSLTQIKTILQRVLTTERKNAAQAYLEDINLMENTLRDLAKVGVVGELINAIVMYMCFSSRKMEQPLHIISLGSSGSGKTHLQECIAELIPEQEIINITSMSDNALYYYPDGALRYILVLVEDMDGMTEDAMYAMRELKSKGFLIRFVPMKDHRGKLETVPVTVRGPICFAGCTTKERIYEDNANRCILLYRDESAAHLEQVMAHQRKAAAGKVNKLEQSKIRELFKDTQMLLKPIHVVNPFAEQLVLPEKVFKPLRTNAHYLKFIEVITFYHQHQRPIKTSASGTKYIETTIEDIEWANRLMKSILLAKSDELSWGIRQFLEEVKNWLKKENKTSFSSMEVRNELRMNPNTVKKYLRILQQYNHVQVTGGSRYKGLEYTLLDTEDYENLQRNIDTILDKVLENVKSIDNQKVK